MSGRDPAQGTRRWAAIVLAAGSSTRMGRPKTRLEWKGSELLTYQATSLRAAGATQVIVVVSVPDPPYVPDPAIAAPNSHPERGKSESLRIGVAALEAWEANDAGEDLARLEAVLICAVDQPREPSLLHELVAAHFENGHDITIPMHTSGRAGHPIVVSHALREELRTASEETQGLRGIVRRDPSRVSHWLTDDESVLLDFNTPEEYERARGRGPAT
ncbi:MAG: nucleotidyltransferase family protein [Candidatus Eisenbacteria bacterium]